MEDFDRPLTKLEELQSHWSDFHKDAYGFRPRFASEAQWNDEAWITAQIKEIDDSMTRQKATFAGREQLRADGWHVPETDPQYIQYAAWLQQEREREQTARWEHA